MDNFVLFAKQRRLSPAQASLVHSRLLSLVRLLNAMPDDAETVRHGNKQVERLEAIENAALTIYQSAQSAPSAQAASLREAMYFAGLGTHLSADFFEDITGHSTGADDTDVPFNPETCPQRIAARLVKEHGETLLAQLALCIANGCRYQASVLRRTYPSGDGRLLRRR